MMVFIIKLVHLPKTEEAIYAQSIPFIYAGSFQWCGQLQIPFHPTTIMVRFEKINTNFFSQSFTALKLQVERQYSANRQVQVKQPIKCKYEKETEQTSCDQCFMSRQQVVSANIFARLGKSGRSEQQQTALTFLTPRQM